MYMLTLDIKDQLFLFNQHTYTTPLQHKGTKALKFKLIPMWHIKVVTIGFYSSFSAPNKLRLITTWHAKMNILLTPKWEILHEKWKFYLYIYIYCMPLKDPKDYAYLTINFKILSKTSSHIYK